MHPRDLLNVYVRIRHTHIHRDIHIYAYTHMNYIYIYIYDAFYAGALTGTCPFTKCLVAEMHWDLECKWFVGIYIKKKIV